MVILAMDGAVTARAFADDYDAIIKKGVDLRRKNQDREALAEFQRALAIRETPRVIAQIGLAEDALGLWVAAEEHLVKALKNDTDPWIVRNIAPLKEALATVLEHIGSVEVWGEPAGAEVVLNGKVVGTLHPSATVRVAAGTCTLVVRAPGYEDLSRGVQVKAGYLVRENVQLVPVLSGRPVAAAVPSVNLAAAEGPAVASIGPSPAPPERSDKLTRKWWFWAALGAVAIAGGATVILATRSRGGVGCPAGVECP